MVTTTSLNGDFNFKANELFKSELAEDHQIAEMAEQQIGAIIEKLVPVLIYVDQDIGEIRGVMVTKEEKFTLVLDRTGKWYRLEAGKVTQNDEEWRYFLLSEVVGGLEEVFTRATATKATHLVAVEKRRDLLSKVGAVIRGEAVPAAEK